MGLGAGTGLNLAASGWLACGIRLRASDLAWGVGTAWPCWGLYGWLYWFDGVLAGHRTVFVAMLCSVRIQRAAGGRGSAGRYCVVTVSFTNGAILHLSRYVQNRLI